VDGVVRDGGEAVGLTTGFPQGCVEVACCGARLQQEVMSFACYPRRHAVCDMMHWATEAMRDNDEGQSRWGGR
jgi:hypothetical protein